MKKSIQFFMFIMALIYSASSLAQDSKRKIKVAISKEINGEKKAL